MLIKVFCCYYSEEWQWLKQLSASHSQQQQKIGNSDGYTQVGAADGAVTDNAPAVKSQQQQQQPTTGQLLFQSKLKQAAQKLLTALGIAESVQHHR